MNKESIALSTPVLFMVFNRLETTKRVFDTIKQAKPSILYLASDGARQIEEGEKETVDEVRNFVVSNIDWECEVNTLFREENLGCGLAVSGAIDWFFENEECGIILEDDCVPSISFFDFASQMLVKYAQTPSIGIIGGFNMFETASNRQNTYSAIKVPVIWGWATWRSTWEKYSFDISAVSKNEINTVVNNVTSTPGSKRFFNKNLFDTSKGRIDTWDFQLMWMMFKENMLTIVPNKNQIENIGFGEDATHTFDNSNPVSFAKSKILPPPYSYKGEIECDDSLTKEFEKHIHTLDWWLYFKMEVRQMLNI